MKESGNGFGLNLIKLFYIAAAVYLAYQWLTMATEEELATLRSYIDHNKLGAGNVIKAAGEWYVDGNRVINLPVVNLPSTSEGGSRFAIIEGIKVRK